MFGYYTYTLLKYFINLKMPMKIRKKIKKIRRLLLYNCFVEILLYYLIDTYFAS